MSQSEETYALTGEQFTQVCVDFAVTMGWIDGPGSKEWLDHMRGYGSSEAFHRSLTVARREAVARTAEGVLIILEVMKKLEAGGAA